MEIQEGQISASECLFQEDEAHFSEVAFFDDLAEDREIVPPQPRGVSRPAWEDLEEPESKPDKKKRSRQEKNLFKKIKLADGQVAYVL